MLDVNLDITILSCTVWKIYIYRDFWDCENVMASDDKWAILKF